MRRPPLPIPVTPPPDWRTVLWHACWTLLLQREVQVYRRVQTACDRAEEVLRGARRDLSRLR